MFRGPDTQPWLFALCSQRLWRLEFLWGMWGTLPLLLPRTCFQVGWAESELEFRNLILQASLLSHKTYYDPCEATA